VPTQFPSGASGVVYVTNPPGNDLVAIGGLPGSNDSPYFLPGHVGVARGTVINPGDPPKAFQVTDSGLLSGIALRDGDIITVQSMLSQADYETPTNDPGPNPLSIEPFAVKQSDTAQNATQVPQDTVITLTLTRPPNPSTVSKNPTVFISPAVTPLTVYINPSNPNQIVFNPNGKNWAMATTYTISIPASTSPPQVTDTNGNPLQLDYSLTFTTYTPPVPAVVSVTPGNNATGIDRSTTITILMNTPVQSGGVNTTNIKLIKQSDSSVVTQMAASPKLSTDGLSITITPSAALLYSNAYYVTVQSLQNALNQTMSNYDGSSGNTGLFTTTSVGAPPTPLVSSVTPGSNATGISTTTTVVIAMNTPVQSAQVTSANIQLIHDSDSAVITQAGGSPSLSTDGKSITVTASAALLFTNAYYVTVQNLVNTNLVAMAAAFNGKTTTPGNVGFFTTTATGAPPTPTVSSCSPGNNATGVAITTHPAVTMNTALNTPGTLVTAANCYLFNTATSSIVTSTVAIDGTNKIITITPSASLTNGVTYYVVIQNQQNTNVVTQSPNPWYGDSRNSNIGQFTTVTLPAPTVSTVTPGSNSTGVAITTTVVVVMSATVTSGPVTTSNVQLLKQSDNSVVTSTVSFNTTDNKTITITPSASLLNSTAYYVVVQNLVGTNTVAQSPSPWYGDSRNASAGLFTTVAPPAAPTVSTVSPGSNSTGVAINTAITITMSIQIKSANVTTSNIILTNQGTGATVATATPTLNSTDKVTITLTPSANLANNTTYYVTVQNQVSVAGSVAQSPSPWYGDSRQGSAGLFTTVNPTPTVSSVTPGSNTGGVAVTSTVAVLMNTPVQSAQVTTANVKLIQASNSNVVSQASGSPSLGSDQKTITISPAANLAYNTTYYVTVANLQNTNNVVQSPNPYDTHSTTGDNQFTTTTSGYVQRYLVSQTTSPCGNNGSTGWDPFSGTGTSYECSSSGYIGIGLGVTSQYTDVLGPAYGQKATTTNGLTTKPIVKVVIQATIGTSNNFGSVNQSTPPTGTMGIKIVNSTGVTKYTFGQTFTASSTGYVTNCTINCGSGAANMNGWQNITFVDTNNTYTMIAGDAILLTWNGTVDNVLLVGCNTGGTGNAVYQDAGGSGQSEVYNVAQQSATWSSYIAASPGFWAAYGATANSSNGLTTGPIQKIILASVAIAGGGSGILTPYLIDASGHILHTFPNSGTISGTVSNLTFTDNSNTVTLAAGQSLVFNWPVGSAYKLQVSATTTLSPVDGVYWNNGGTDQTQQTASGGTSLAAQIWVGTSTAGALHAITNHDLAATMYSAT